MNIAIAIDTAPQTTDAERELRHALVRAWRANPRQGSAAHAAYAMIRGKSLNKTFSPVSNTNKLAHNCSNPYQQRDNAIDAAKSGSRSAWAWAVEALAAQGLEADRYGRYPLATHPIIGAWIQKSLAEMG